MAASGTVLGLKTADGRRPRVALVGGTPASALVAGVLIEQFGGSTVAAPTGAAMLARLGSGDDFDLVVLDLALPDGMVVAQLIRTLGGRNPVPVIALSDSREEISAPGARAAAFTGAVIKPYSPRELYGAMQVALHGPATAVSGTA
jgi:CheY-like chemotaxis protein